MLVIALGDGIRQEAETLAGLLQSHAGSHFTFALVELATWRDPKTRDILAVPNTLAQTLMIERGIVRIEDGRPIVAPVPEDPTAKPQSLSMTEFYELMAARDPELPAAIRSFIEQLEPLGVYAELIAGLNFKADLPELGKPLNFGYIKKNGKVSLDPARWSLRYLPDTVWKPYLHDIARAIGGSVILGETPELMSYVVKDKSVPLVEQVLPAHTDAWVDAIASTIERVRHDAAAKP